MPPHSLLACELAFAVNGVPAGRPVEGGLIRETAPDGIRILLFPDASSHRITLTGTYPSGTTFREEMVL